MKTTIDIAAILVIWGLIMLALVFTVPALSQELKCAKYGREVQCTESRPMYPGTLAAIRRLSPLSRAAKQEVIQTELENERLRLEIELLRQALKDGAR